MLVKTTQLFLVDMLVFVVYSGIHMHVDLSKHVRPIDTHAVCHTCNHPSAQPAPLSIAPPKQHCACTCLSVTDDSCVCRPKTSPTVGRGVYFQSSFDFGRFACIILDNSMRDSAFLVSPELTGGVYDVKYLFQSLIPNTSHGSAVSVNTVLLYQSGFHCFSHRGEVY